MFVGRENELKSLEKLYSNDDFQFVIIYGRRRVGKTFLISEFLEGKKNIYFSAEQYSEKVLLEKFSNAILSVFPSDIIDKFQGFDRAFLYIAEKAMDERIVLVIDEFQYLVYQNKGILSMLQHIIDHQMLKTKLFFIVCGSYISFMENEVLAYKSPLFGRRTAQLRIHPFNYLDSSKFLPQYSDEEKISLYGIAGGIPMYLNQFKNESTIKDCIINNILSKGSLLRDEPIFALKQELTDPAIYLSVITAIAHGKTKFNEINTKVGTDCGAYLNTLIELGIIKKEIPLGALSNSRKSIYKIEDNYFHFWFRFLDTENILLAQENYELFYETVIAPNLSSYLGYKFEKVCYEWISSKNGRAEIPFLITALGRWWGNNPKLKAEMEIDLIGIDGDENLLACECKWWTDVVGMNVLRDLIDKSSHWENKKMHYGIFSKSGFTKELLEEGKKCDNVMLVSLEDMYK